MISLGIMEPEKYGIFFKKNQNTILVLDFYVSFINLFVGGAEFFFGVNVAKSEKYNFWHSQMLHLYLQEVYTTLL